VRNLKVNQHAPNVPLNAVIRVANFNMANTLFQAPELTRQSKEDSLFTRLTKHYDDCVKKWNDTGLLEGLDETNKINLANIFESGAEFIIFWDNMRIVESSEERVITVFFPILRRIYSLIYRLDYNSFTDYEAKLNAASLKLNQEQHVINFPNVMEILIDEMSKVDQYKDEFPNVDYEAEACVWACNRYVLESASL
jgi:hypothetical protein